LALHFRLNWARLGQLNTGQRMPFGRKIVARLVIHF
jgi:hypothetical protein